MTKQSPQNDPAARAMRQVAMVIAAAGVLWIAAQWLGGRMGLDASYFFLFDLAAIAAFIWALIVTWGIWQRQKRGNAKGGN